jgi:hypothetical protein
VAKQEEHPEKSKCLFMFYEQNAWRSQHEGKL